MILISELILNDFRRDYEKDLFDTEEDLIIAYKRILETLVSIDCINIMQSNEISEKLNQQMLYFKEWY